MVMARPLSKGERPLDWVGSSKRDFLNFPGPVKDEMGNALGLAQFGGKHPAAKPWKGQGPGVFEIVEDHGVRSARQDIDLIEQRLKAARRDHEERYGKAKR